jgi:hypothetical protein
VAKLSNKGEKTRAIILWKSLGRTVNDKILPGMFLNGSIKITTFYRKRSKISLSLS